MSDDPPKDRPNQGRRRSNKDQDWEIPPALRPNPDDYSFDLEQALKSVVSLKTYVPTDAFTANNLGTERAGSGVMIKDTGLIATIGYLITEAETIWITSNDGQVVPGHALAMDQETGFGLVQALGKLNLPHLEMGDSDSLAVGDQAVMAAGGGRHHAVETRLVGRQEKCARPCLGLRSLGQRRRSRLRPARQAARSTRQKVHLLAYGDRCPLRFRHGCAGGSSKNPRRIAGDCFSFSRRQPSHRSP